MKEEEEEEEADRNHLPYRRAVDSCNLQSQCIPKEDVFRDR